MIQKYGPTYLELPVDFYKKIYFTVFLTKGKAKV